MPLPTENPYWCGNQNNSIPTQIDATNFINASGSSFYAQVDWSQIELTLGNYTWTVMDNAINFLKSNNLRICLVLQGAPDFHKAVVSGSGDTKTYMIPADASTFINTVLNHYPAGTFQYIIIGNEEYSNYTPSNGLKDPCIGQPLLAAVAPTIRAFDSTIKIGMFPLLNGGTQANIDAWWQIMFTGVSPQFGTVTAPITYVDFPTLHYYSDVYDPSSPNPKGLNMWTWMNSFKSKRSLYGGLAYAFLQMKITEYGWTATGGIPGPHQVTDTQQGTYMSHFLDIARRSGVVSNVSYFNFGGLFKGNGTIARPAYTTLQNYAIAFPQWNLTPVGSWGQFMAHH